MARDAGFGNLNLDLMLGLPGQSVQQWTQTLEQAIALSPEHLSCYALIVEEGTPLCGQVERGECAPLPDEEALWRMDEGTERLTREAGSKKSVVVSNSRTRSAYFERRKKYASSSAGCTSRPQSGHFPSTSWLSVQKDSHGVQ